jgi:hypothetical protein
LASQGLVAADIAQRQIVAYYLAQDAQEWIINKKTSNKLVPQDILRDLGSCVVDASGGHGCSINTFDGLISSCSSSGCSSSGKLYIENYTYKPDNTNGNDSGFIRFSKIEKVEENSGNTVEAKVSTTVKWTAANGTEQTYTLVSNISSW